MVDLLIRGGGEPGRYGTLVSVTPERANWRFVGFDAIRLAPGKTGSGSHSAREACIVLLAGNGELRAGSQTLDALDGRASPFDGPPHALYAPPGTEVTVHAGSRGLELAIGTAPASVGPAVQLIRPADATVEIRGNGHAQRTIRNLL